MTLPQINLHKCPSCDRTGPANMFVDDPLDGYLCGDCGEKVDFHEARPARWVSVALYEVGRSYGGPEEGGWYYDTGTREDSTLRCFEIGDWPQAKLYAEQLEAQVIEAASFRGGPRYTVRIHKDELAPDFFPSRRPVYC